MHRVDIGKGSDLHPWDWRYCAEKVRRERFAIDDAAVKPYFQIANMVQAAFDCAGRLFGSGFTLRQDLPWYHPDVKAEEVCDAAGAVLGFFLQNNFARAGNRSGAWVSALRCAGRPATRSRVPKCRSS